ncbi:hypothetical protein [Haliea salexigens]|uniref:hypothetical protein n=1 Tax=Haliea salexigens TaxID=287487 RepID=UPI0004822343|nr:hypothetical protein [Haliea salexigens]
MITCSSLNKPVSITTASVNYGFDNGPDGARYRKVHNGQTTHYVGKNFEAINTGGLGFDTHRHYVRANGRVIMILEDVNGRLHTATCTRTTWMKWGLHILGSHLPTVSRLSGNVGFMGGMATLDTGSE